LTYTIPNWKEEELLPLLNTIGNILDMVERYNDKVLLRQLHLLVNLLAARQVHLYARVKRGKLK